MMGTRGRIEVLHGVNLNLLGARDPLHYGTLTLADLEAQIAAWAAELELSVSFFQTNAEAEYVERLHECVTGGGVAVIPTDTVYGVCCDPDDEHAARRLYALKGRTAARPAAVMFFALEPALAELGELHPDERAAIRALLPGPVTLLLANPRRRFAPA